MSVITTKALQCDTCYRIEDFGLITPYGAPELRRAAEKEGWSHSRYLSSHGWRYPDTCKTCREPAL